MSLVSIIIPVYNRKSLLAETMECILRQTYTHWECLVVDDGSTDGTQNLVVNYAKHDTRIRLFQRPIHKEKGAPSCRNYGLEQAQGDWIMFFDSDDILLPEALFERLLAVLAYPELDFGVFQTQRFYQTIGDDPMVWNDLTKPNIADFNDFMTLNPVWHTSGPLWKREFLVQNTLSFTEGVLSWQDWEFHIRVLLKTPRYKKFPDLPIGVFQRFHEGVAINKMQEEAVLINRLKTIEMLAVQLEGACILNEQRQWEFAKLTYFNLRRLPHTVNILPLWRPMYKFYSQLPRIDLWFWSRYLYIQRNQARRGYYRLLKIMGWTKKVYFRKRVAVDEIPERTWYKQNSS